MVHPIFTVLVSKPELVIGHVAGYAALMREEASSVGSIVARRAIVWGLTLFAFLVFLLLAGMAVMLGAVHNAFHWTLVVVPSIALVVGIVGLFIARQTVPEKAFTQLRAQLDADTEALKAIGARS